MTVLKFYCFLKYISRIKAPYLTNDLKKKKLILLFNKNNKLLLFMDK